MTDKSARRRALPLAVFPLTAIVLSVGIAFYMFRDWHVHVREAQVAAVTRAETVSTLIADVLDRVMENVTSDFVFLGQRIDELNGDLGEVRLNRVLSAVIPPRGVIQYAYVDPRGTILASSIRLGAAGIDLSDREHIQAVIAGDRDLHLGLPIVGRVSGQASLNLTKAKTASDGTLHGILVASVELSELDQFFSRSGGGDQVEVVIVGHDGIVRYQRPKTSDPEPATIAVQEFINAVRAGQSIPWTGPHPTSLTQAVGYVATLPSRKIAVYVGQTLDQIKSKEYSELLSHAVSGLLLIAALLLAGGLATRLVRRERELALSAHARDVSQILAGLASSRNNFVIHDLVDGDPRLKSRTLRDLLDRPLPPHALDSLIRAVDVLHRRNEPGMYVDRHFFDGAESEIVWVSVPLKTGMPPLTAYVGIDRSEAMRNEQAMHRLGRLATLGEMSTALAHELTQPLNVINLVVANIRRSARVLPEGPATELGARLDRIGGQIARARGIIDHMRVYGRKDLPGQQNCDPIALLHGLETVLGEQLRLLLIKLEIVCERPMPRVTIGEGQLEQVLINVVLNARDAILGRAAPGASCKGTITIVCETVPAQSAVRFLVTDTGGGISESALPRLFEPFFTTKPPGVGTGLGLSVAFGILKDNGGSITARNVTHGAEFTVTVPVAAERAPEAAA